MGGGSARASPKVAAGVSFECDPLWWHSAASVKNPGHSAMVAADNNMKLCFVRTEALKGRRNFTILVLG